MSNMHKNDIHENLNHLFESGEYSDLTIRCRDSTFKVHRAIVCPRSRFFSIACNGEFKESIDGVILLEEDEPESVQRMLKYIYTSDYDDGSLLSSTETASEAGSVTVEDDTSVLSESHSSRGVVEEHGEENGTVDEAETIPDQQSESKPWLLNNILVYIIAEKYGITGLKEAAKLKFEDQAETLLSAEEFPEIIKSVYAFTPESDRGLRDITSRVCGQQLEEVVNTPALSAILEQNGEYCLDVLRYSLSQSNEHLGGEMALRMVLESDLQLKEKKIKYLEHQLNYVKKMLRKLGENVEAGVTSSINTRAHWMDSQEF